jgi:cobalamin biosynthesis protein CobD/CbiB
MLDRLVLHAGVFHHIIGVLIAISVFHGTTPATTIGWPISFPFSLSISVVFFSFSIQFLVSHMTRKKMS